MTGIKVLLKMNRKKILPLTTSKIEKILKSTQKTNMKTIKMNQITKKIIKISILLINTIKVINHNNTERE